MTIADSNRTRLAVVRELVPGTTPATPAWRQMRVTADSIKATVGVEVSDEILSDRQTSSQTPVSVSVAGDVSIEMAPRNADDIIEGAMMSLFTKTPEITNSAADTEITDAGTTANTYTVASGGAAFLAGHLVRASVFANAANNQLFRVTSSSGTTVVGTSLGLTAETAPPAGAKLKVLGIRAAANGSISATLTGGVKTITVATTNPTTLGLVAGMWFRAAGFTGTAADNGWYRVQSITGSGPWVITCDRAPAGFATDAAAGQIVDLFFSDYVRNGTTQIFSSFERAYLDVLQYMYFRGCQIDGLKTTITAEKKIEMSFTVSGMDGPAPTGTRFAGSTDIAPAVSQILSASASIGTIYETGVQLTQALNFVSMLEIVVANNTRRRPVIMSIIPQQGGYGDCDITGTLTAYFVDGTRLAALRAGTPGSVTVIIADQNTGEGYLYDIPYFMYSDGDAPVGGKSQDVNQKLPFRALKDPTLLYQLHVQKVAQ